MGVELFMFQFYPMREGLEVFARELLPELQRDIERRARSEARVVA